MVYAVDASIIIPFFNAQATLERTIDSAVSQEFAGRFEVILVDDGSRPAGRAWIPVQNRACRVSLLRHRKNLGLAAAKNTGIERSLGQTVMFVDGDDSITEFTLAELYAALMQARSLMYVWPTYLLRDVDGYNVGSHTGRLGSGVLFRKPAFNVVGLFKEGLRVNEEKAWYERADRAGLRGQHIPTAYYYYWQTPNSLTRTNGTPKPS